MITHAAHRKQYTVLLDRSRRGVFYLVTCTGLEPISMQLSGGQLLRPVRKLGATFMGL